MHLPLARLRAAGAGKDALVEAVTAEVASLVNDATVTFVDSGEDDVAGPAGRGEVRRVSSTSKDDARPRGAPGVRRAGHGWTRPPPPTTTTPGDSPPGDSPRRRVDDARTCKADDTSATTLYAPLREVASANAEHWGERCVDAPEVVHVVRGDVDAIARDARVSSVDSRARSAPPRRLYTSNRVPFYAPVPTDARR